MVKKKRVYKSVLGIPIWMLFLMSSYFIASVLYDFIVGDTGIRRQILLCVSLVILIFSMIVGSLKIETIIKIARNGSAVK